MPIQESANNSYRQTNPIGNLSPFEFPFNAVEIRFHQSF